MAGATGCELRASEKVVFIYILMFVPVSVQVYVYRCIILVSKYK